ncbi:MAG: SRPBCC family protein [Thermoplasmata archaeon]
MTENPPQGMNPGDVGGPGILQVDQEKASIVFRRLFRHPIEDVWSAVTDPKKIEVWFMAKVTRENSPGGRLAMEHPNGVHATGRVLEWRPPRAYEYEWNLPPGPNQPRGETSIVRWELNPADEGTLLVLSHRKLTRPTAQVFARGLPDFLDRLSAHLDGTPLPDPPWVSRAASSSSAT